MNRRDFLKGMSLVALSVLLPSNSYSSIVDLSKVQFNNDIYNINQAQTIMVYLYGGASELGGNLTNLDEIQQKSQNKYDLNYLTPTKHYFWSQAGGEAMERMLANGDMNIFRTCYRKANPTRSHGICTAENQRGVMDEYAPGIFSNLAQILYSKGVINSETILPFLTMEGESDFFATAQLNLEMFLRPSAINENLDNPYARKLDSRLYTKDEWDSNPRPTDTIISKKFDEIAKGVNKNLILQNAFDKRALLERFIEDIKQKPLPENINYPNNTFAKKLKTAVTILANNPDTKVISVGSGGLGGWDDHSNAVDNYKDRMSKLMEAIEIALAHLKALGKTNINIIVFAEFGRNVNLNDAKGWDHGNNQNVYIFGGKKYFNHVGVVGETELKPTEENNRLFLKPKDNSYWFEPYAVAATIYKLYGITNPEILTGGYGAIDAGLFR